MEKRTYPQKFAIIFVLVTVGAVAWQHSQRTDLINASSAVAASRTVPITSAVQKSTDSSCPYGNEKFTWLIKESYGYCGSDNAKGFYDWFDNAYSQSHSKFPGKENMKLQQVLDTEKTELKGIKDPSLRTKSELELCEWAHKMVKEVIPRFSLENGFEFYKVYHQGQRQCLLQSTLIAGMFNQMGIDAGIAMVNVSNNGESSNNGHVVTLVRLANGKHVIVDASHPDAFVAQQGLLVRDSDYRYVKPVYTKDASGIPFITSYRTASGGNTISNRNVRTLDYSFMRSQYWYYRGERAVDGILAKSPTAAGLQKSQEALEKSVSICPGNPLPAYMLGRIYLMQGDADKAAKTIQAAVDNYARYGWVPDGPKQFLASARNRQRSHSQAGAITGP